MFSFRLRSLLRVPALVVMTSLLASVVDIAPVDAAQTFGAIDPLQRLVAVTLPKGSARASFTSFSGKTVTAPNHYPVFQKAPIPYTPFPVIDPSTKAQVASVATITAPSGKRVVAGTYWAQVNAVEKYLASNGHSLREGKNIDLGVEKNGTQAVLLSTHVIRGGSGKATMSPAKGLVPLGSIRALLPNQLLAKAPSSVSASTADTKHVVPVTGSQLGKLGSSGSQAIAAPNPSTLPYGYKSMTFAKPLDPLPPEVDTPTFADTHSSPLSYSETGGNSSVASYVLTTDLSAGGDPSGKQTFVADAKFSGEAFSNSVDIFSASFHTTGSAASIDVEAAGNSIYTKSYTLPFNDSFDQAGTFIKVTAPIYFGPFFIQLAVEVDGDAGVDIEASGGEQNAQYGVVPVADVTPHFQVAGSFSAEFGVGVADVASLSLGTDGDITIANVSIPLLVSAGFGVSALHTGTKTDAKSIYACQTNFQYGIQGELQYQFLAGSLSYYVRGCFLVCDTLISGTYFSWNGWSGDKTLFNASNSVAIGALYSDLPEYGRKLDPGNVYSADDASGMPTACDNLYKALGEAVPA